jgi:hypothetical protein
MDRAHASEDRDDQADVGEELRGHDGCRSNLYFPIAANCAIDVKQPKSVARKTYSTAQSSRAA